MLKECLWRPRAALQCARAGAAILSSGGDEGEREKQRVGNESRYEERSGGKKWLSEGEGIAVVVEVEGEAEVEVMVLNRRGGE